jgi:hypothetical protein
MRKSDSEVELEFEVPVTLEDAENATNLTLNKLFALPTPTPSILEKEKPQSQMKASVVYPNISKPKSCSDGITALLLTEWGKQPRTMAELREALAFNAIYYPEGTFKSTLTKMTKAGKLRRLKKDRLFAYVLP